MMEILNGRFNGCLTCRGKSVI